MVSERSYKRKIPSKKRRNVKVDFSVGLPSRLVKNQKIKLPIAPSYPAELALDINVNLNTSSLFPSYVQQARSLHPVNTNTGVTETRNTSGRLPPSSPVAEPVQVNARVPAPPSLVSNDENEVEMSKVAKAPKAPVAPKAPAAPKAPKAPKPPETSTNPHSQLMEELLNFKRKEVDMSKFKEFEKSEGSISGKISKSPIQPKTWRKVKDETGKIRFVEE